MAASEDIQSWAKRLKLAPDITAILEENGFTTVDELAVLTPADIKESFQDTKLLNIAQCLALKRAVATLAPGQSVSSPPMSAPSWTTSPSSQPGPPQAQPYPVYQPQPYPPHHQPYPSQSQPYPPQPYPSQPYPHPSQPYPSAPSGFQAAPHGAAAPYLSYPHGAGAQPQPQPQACTSPEQVWAPAGQSSWEGGAGASTVGQEVPSGMNDPDGESTECFRFLLLGKTGSGKSTTGNTIFGEVLFDTAATFSSVTSDCERKTNTRAGRKIEILDSPGLYDTHKTQEEIGVTIVQAVAGMHPGPHAILYVVRVGRYTAEEHGAYKRLKSLFDEDISRYMIVVFTHGDMLEREQRSVSDLIESGIPQSLQQVLRECNNRYVVFNNMAPNRQPQVEHLLQMVRQLVADNGGQPYSCPKYASIGQGMEEEVARRLQEVEKRDLQRQKYVQQLEQHTKEAEETARRTQEQYQKNEEERQRQMEAAEERRQQMEEQLQAKIEEQQIGFEKYQQELQRLHQEREEQELMMREKEAQMSEMEKRRAEEDAERIRQQEQEMQTRLAEYEERLQRQRQEDEERRQQMEQEKQELLAQLEEQRRKDREELEKREEEREKLREQQLEEERQAAKRREENYEKEMEKLKGQVVAKQATDFVSACAAALRGVIHILAEIGRISDNESSGRSRMDGRDLFGVPYSNRLMERGYGHRLDEDEDEDEDEER